MMHYSILLAMHYIHDPYQPKETIAAIATPIGVGGVAIIRISGEKALEVADRIFSGPVKKYKSHTAHYGKVIDQKGCFVDNALVLVMLAPKSFTGEDTVEIHCHGGNLIALRVLDTAVRAGARVARPGEFSYKAFINGKIDLTQAEGIQEMISAKSERALDAAENQLQGRLSSMIRAFQGELTELAAILEASVDFPEEGLEFMSQEEFAKKLAEITKKLKHLIRTFHDGSILRDGISLCLIGSPNVGKSSLMNALLNKNRAIVTDIAGTTRDILEDDLRLNGLNFRLIDTAGIRKSKAFIEREGIRRSKEAFHQADLVLLVLDANRGIKLEDKNLLAQAPKDKTILVWNKIDLPHNGIPILDFPHFTSVSAREKTGLDALKIAIDKVIWKDGPPSKEEVLISNKRHFEAIAQAVVSLENVLQGFKDSLSPEFLTIDMRKSLQELGKVIGTNVGEDILSSIFSKFCIGK